MFDEYMKISGTVSQRFFGLIVVDGEAPMWIGLRASKPSLMLDDAGYPAPSPW